MKSREQCVAELAQHRFTPCLTCIVELIDARLRTVRKKLERVSEGELKDLQGRIDELKKLRTDLVGSERATDPGFRDE